MRHTSRSHRTMILRALGLLAVLVVATALAPAAASAADFGVTEFEASAANTQAGAHSDVTTTIEFKSERYVELFPGFGDVLPNEAVQTIALNLPPGLLANAAKAPTCLRADFAVGHCAVEDQVGNAVVTTSWLANPPTGLMPWNPIYNLAPAGDTPASLGLMVGPSRLPAFIDIGVDSASDYHVTATSSNIETVFPIKKLEITLWGVPADPSHDPERLSEFGSGGVPSTAPRTPFMVNSTDCATTPVTGLRATSYYDSAVTGEAASPNPTGCDQLAFDPTIKVTPDVTAPDAPTGVAFDFAFPQDEDPDGLGTPALRTATVDLPAGMTINPGAAGGLAACTDAESAIGTEAAASCPEAAKVGTATIDVPALRQPLEGALYIGTQESDDPASGKMYRLFLVADGQGVHLKLEGQVRVDPASGALKATFAENPQVPVSEIELHLKDGPRAPLATPSTCGPKTTTAELAPWGGQAVERQSTFDVDCAAGLGRFSPSFQAGAVTPTAGASSPLVIKVGREDGEGALRSIDFTLPPGETGRLAGVPYCPEAAIAAAAGRSGRAEQADPSCPAASRIGSVDTAAGAGSAPFHVPGTVYLAGPYKGAPISAVVVTPAVAGAFDLGTVVVRAPLYVDPETTQITAKSDPIPTVLGGVPLRLRSVAITIDRPGFSQNPTNCEAMAVGATLGSAGGATATPSNRFQVGGCKDLAFGPRLKLRVMGKTNRGAKPRLRAVVTTSPGEANIRRAQVNLPHSEFLEQDHIKTVCTRVQWNEGDGNGSACPAGSIYGRAVAWTPLLDHPLEGYVYLRSNGGERKLPDLVAGLNGQVSIALWGKVDSGPNHGIRNTFEVVPDAPVSRFVLEMNGGKKGLLVNSEDLCGAPKAQRRAVVRFTGQNGKVSAFKPLVGNECGKAKKGTKKSAGHAPTR